MLSSATRVPPVVLADTAQLTVPSPIPGPGPMIVTHDGAPIVVHTHAGVLVVTLNEPTEAFDGIVAAGGEMTVTHPASGFCRSV